MYKPQLRGKSFNDTINNPEKKIPDSILNKFFLTLKSGDIDKIKEFVTQNKIRYGITEARGRGVTNESGKTPYHVILELDDQILSNDGKLRILNFLDTMGAPLDLPDSQNMWPIHLAAQLQSRDIINFFIKKKVDINRKDSSNNTPLHYAIFGKEMPCRIHNTINPLVPPVPIDNANMNNVLNNVSMKIMELLNAPPAPPDPVSDVKDIIHNMIATITTDKNLIQNNDKYIQTYREVYEIFTQSALSTRYSSDNNANLMTSQQTAIEQLIEKISGNIKTEYLLQSLLPLDIMPYNTGWGPDNKPENKILSKSSDNIQIDVRNSVDTSAPNWNGTLSNLHETLTDTPDYIHNCIYDTLYSDDQGLSVTCNKLTQLFIVHDYCINYGYYFVKKILKNYRLADNTQLSYLYRVITDIDDEASTRREIRQLINSKINSDILDIQNGVIDISLPKVSTNHIRINDKILFRVLSRPLDGLIDLLPQNKLDNEMKNIINMIYNDPTISTIKPYHLYTTRNALFKYLFKNDGEYNDLKSAKENILTPLMANAFDFLKKNGISGKNNTIIDLLDITLKKYFTIDFNTNPVKTARRNYVENGFNLATVENAGFKDLVTKGKIAYKLYVDVYIRYRYSRGASHAVAIDKTSLTVSNIIKNYDALTEAVKNGLKDVSRPTIPNNLIFRDPYNPALYAAHIAYYNNFIVPAHANMIARDPNMFNPPLVYNTNALLAQEIDQMKKSASRMQQVYGALGPKNLFTNKYPIKENRLLDVIFYIDMCITLIKYHKIWHYKESYSPVDLSHKMFINVLALDGIDKKNVNVYSTNEYMKTFSLEQYQTYPELMFSIQFIAALLNHGIHKHLIPPTTVFINSILSDDIIFDNSPNANLLKSQISVARRTYHDLDVALMYAILFPRKHDLNNANIADLKPYTDRFHNMITNMYDAKLHVHISNRNIFDEILNTTQPANPSQYYLRDILFKDRPYMSDTAFVEIAIELQNNIKTIITKEREMNNISQFIDIIIHGVNGVDKPNLHLEKPETQLPKYLIELVLWIYVYVNHLFIRLHGKTANIRWATDAITLLLSEDMYYIPQVFLPLMIKYILISITYLRKKILKLVEHTNDVLKYVALGDKFDAFRTNRIIYDYYNTFIKNIDDRSRSIVQDFKQLIDNHNDVIRIINMKSASNYLAEPRELFFTGELLPIHPFIDIIMKRDDAQLVDVFDKYRVNNVTYIANPLYDYSKLQYIFKGYPNMYYKYGPQVPKHLQVDFALLNINNQVRGNDGPLLNWDLGIKFKDIEFGKGYIGFDTSTNIANYNILPATFKIQSYANLYKSLDMYILYNKYRVIEKILKHLYDNKTTIPYWQELQTLTSGTYNLSDSKVLVILGVVLDRILSDIIQHSTRVSASEWINTTFLKQIHNPPAGNIDIAFVNKNYAPELSLKATNETIIQKILDPAHVSYKLPQIEGDINNIDFVTQVPIETNVKYNNNYTGQLLQYKCYFTDLEIIKKLINADTINVKNSDGMTPLHLAIEAKNYDAIDLLLKMSNNTALTFKNNLGMTPIELLLNEMRDHISKTIIYKTMAVGFESFTINDSLKQFYVPVNDTLLSTLRDSKFGNNIIDSITLCAPIMLIMINHYFSNYVNNYRNNFDVMDKKNITYLFDKYLGIKLSSYPYDLFDLSDIELYDVLNDTPSNVLNAKNKKFNNPKIIQLNSQITIIETQINGLNDELKTESDNNRKNVITSALSALNVRLLDIKNQLNKIDGKIVQTVTEPIINTYNAGLTNIKNYEKTTVTDDIIDFYNYAYNQIANSNKTYKNIWKKYTSKLIDRCPSMFIINLNKIINILITGNNISNHQNDIVMIMKIYEKIKKYYDSKSIYPNNYVDNYILQIEYVQIKYILNLIITPAIINIIVNFIDDDIRNSNLFKVDDPNANITSIITHSFNGLTISEYMKNNYTDIAIKYFTTIYNKQYDPDKKITNPDDIFTPLLSIIKSFRPQVLTDNSFLIINIKTYMVPFVTNTYKAAITAIISAKESFMLYNINTCALVKILEKLSI